MSVWGSKPGTCDGTLETYSHMPPLAWKASISELLMSATGHSPPLHKESCLGFARCSSIFMQAKLIERGGHEVFLSRFTTRAATSSTQRRIMFRGRCPDRPLALLQRQLTLFGCGRPCASSKHAPSIRYTHSDNILVWG